MNLSTLDATALSTQINMNSPGAIDGQAAAQTLGQLIADVNSGNITTARQDLATLTKQMDLAVPKHTALGGLLTQLNNDLGTGNVVAAQTDVSNFITAVSGTGNQSYERGIGSAVTEHQELLTAGRAPAGRAGSTNST